MQSLRHCCHRFKLFPMSFFAQPCCSTTVYPRKSSDFFHDNLIHQQPIEDVLELEQVLALGQTFYEQLLDTVLLGTVQEAISSANERREELDSFELNRLQKRALVECLPQLCLDLDLMELLVLLQSKATLSRVQVGAIEAEKTEYERRKALINILCAGDSKSFEDFIECLVQSNQSHIATIISLQLHDVQEGQLLSTNRKSTARTMLENLYTKSSFRFTNPFSFPYEFDIEETFVSVALSDSASCSTDDHCEIIRKAFTPEKRLLIIEGEAASGKTSLLRRIAFDWANGDSNMKHYDLALIMEFRHIQGTKSATILELVLQGMQKQLLHESEFADLRRIVDESFCRSHRILILLDGYDEAVPKDACEELAIQLKGDAPTKPLLVDVVLSTRPGHTSNLDKEKARRVNFAKVLGFDTMEKKVAYINAHFRNQETKVQDSRRIIDLLSTNKSMNKIAETPLFLAFICIVHDKLKIGSLFELYECIVWWLLDRYQQKHAEVNVPELMGYLTKHLTEQDNALVIQDHYFEFPLLLELGKVAFDLQTEIVFKDAHFKKNTTTQFQEGIKNIIVPVGLLCKDQTRNGLRVNTVYTFPHKTIQEFLAGAVNYLWHEVALNRKFSSEIFTKQCSVIADLTHDIPEHLKMNELEKFIWRISLNPNGKIEEKTVPFFSRYQTLSIDISILETATGNCSQILNEYLSKCNVTQLIVYTTDKREFTAVEPINVSEMHQLESVVIACPTKFTNIQNGTSSNLNSMLFLSPQKFLRTIALKNCTFSTPKYFTSAMDYFADMTNSSATLEVINIVVEFSNQPVCQRLVVSSNKELLTDYRLKSGDEVQINGDVFSESRSTFNNLACAKTIQLFGGLDSDNKRNEIFWEIVNAKLMQLEKLCVASFKFFDEKTFLLPAKIQQLTELKLINCKFSMISWQSIVTILSKIQNGIRKMELEQQSFSSKEAFEHFFKSLEKHDFLTELKINFDEIEGADQTDENDITALICSLITNMSKLSVLNLSQNSCAKPQMRADANQVVNVGRSKNVEFDLKIDKNLWPF